MRRCAAVENFLLIGLHPALIRGYGGLPVVILTCYGRVRERFHFSFDFALLPARYAVFYGAEAVLYRRPCHLTVDTCWTVFLTCCGCLLPGDRLLPAFTLKLLRCLLQVLFWMTLFCCSAVWATRLFLISGTHFRHCSVVMRMR